VDYLASDVYKALQFQFSSGVRLHELVSIAQVVASLAGCTPPTKKEKRSYLLMVKWFHDRWAKIGPWIPVTNLRDEGQVPITARREGIETLIMTGLSRSYGIP
jgi:hypothetical protein